MTAFINLSLAILRDVVSPQQDINYYPGTYKPPLPSGCAVGFTSRGCRKSKEGLGYGREEARGGAPPSQSTVAPPNFSLTKSPVLKPAHPAVSPETRSPSTPSPTSSIDRPLCTQENIGILLFSIVSFLAVVSSSHETLSLQKNAVFFGGGGLS